MNGIYTVFKTFQNCYLYDANINKIINITEELYNNLEKDKIYESSEFKKLKELNFFENNKRTMLQKPETDVLKYFYDRKIGNVIFQVTQNCNLRCAYCPYSQENNLNRNHTNLMMPIEMGKRVMDYILQHSVDRNKISIGFYGGEPLLNFQLIKDLVNYANSIFCGKKLEYSITTNLTVITKEMLDFCEKNQFDMMISLDGSKASNDKNRKFYKSDRSTFDVIIQNLKVIADNYPNIKDKCSISMVMDPSETLDEYEFLLKEYPFMKEFKYNSVIKEDLFCDIPNKWNNVFKAEYYYKIFLCYMREIKKYLFKEELIFFDNSSEVLQENLNSFNLFDMNNYNDNEYVLTSGMCSLGKNKLFINAQGKFYPCEKVGESNPEFIIGDIESGFYLSKCQTLLNFTNEFSDHCLNCIAMRDCQMCIKEFAVSGVYNEKSIETCAKYREVFKTHLVARATLHEALDL